MRGGGGLRDLSHWEQPCPSRDWAQINFRSNSAFNLWVLLFSLARGWGIEVKVKYGVRSSKFIGASCAQVYSLAETPHPPPPAFGLIYEGAISQPRQTTSLCGPLDRGHSNRGTQDQVLCINWFKGTVAWDGFFLSFKPIQGCKKFGFVPKLMEIDKFFRCFCCLAYSPYMQRAVFKFKIKITFVICSS